MGLPHPSDQTLRAYRSGQLDDGRAEEVRKHLETCSDCWGRAAAMASASFVDWLGGADGCEGLANRPDTA